MKLTTNVRWMMVSFKVVIVSAVAPLISSIVHVKSKHCCIVEVAYDLAFVMVKSQQKGTHGMSIGSQHWTLWGGGVVCQGRYTKVQAIFNAEDHHWRCSIGFDCYKECVEYVWWKNIYWNKQYVKYTYIPFQFYLKESYCTWLFWILQICHSMSHIQGRLHHIISESL
jgi:hypothetical protein